MLERGHSNKIASINTRVALIQRVAIVLWFHNKRTAPALTGFSTGNALNCGIGRKGQTTQASLSLDLDPGQQ